MVWETQVHRGEDGQSLNRTDTFFFLLSFCCLKETAFFFFFFFNIPNEGILLFRLLCHLFSLGLALLSAQWEAQRATSPPPAPTTLSCAQCQQRYRHTHTPPTCHSCTIFQTSLLPEDTGHYPLSCILMWLSRNSLIVPLQNSTGPNSPSALLYKT